jgi:hypothetical protein
MIPGSTTQEDALRKIILAVLAIGAMAAISASPAEAWGGCGINRHPTPFGCRWNGPGWVHPGWYGHPGWRYRHWHRWHRHW